MRRPVNKAVHQEPLAQITGAVGWTESSSRGFGGALAQPNRRPVVFRPVGWPNHRLLARGHLTPKGDAAL